MHFTLATLVTVRLVLLLQELQATAPTTVPEECQFWKYIVDSRCFRDLLLDAATSSCLDILLPPEFGVEEIRLLTKLLKVLPTSQKIHSKIAGYCLYNCSTMESRHVELRLFCRTANPWYVDLIPHPYWATLSTVTSSLKEFNLGLFQSAVEGKDDFEKLRNGVDFHIVVRDDQILMAGSYDVRCLNCTPDVPRDFNVGLTRHMPIRGR